MKKIVLCIISLLLCASQICRGIELTRLNDALSLFGQTTFKKPNAAERVRGAIFGGVIGDALGRSTEFTDSLEGLKKTFTGPEEITLSWYYTNQTIPTASGKKIIYTDDTVLSKLLLEDSIEARKNGSDNDRLLCDFSKHAIAWVFTKGFVAKNKPHITDPLYGYRAHGNQNIAAFDRMHQRTRRYMRLYEGGNECDLKWWHVKSSLEEQQKGGGCGSVMRAWPLGLIFFDDLERVKKLAVDQSLITHQHPFAQAACEALALGVALLIQGEDYKKVTDAMIAAAKEWDKKIKIVQMAGVQFVGDLSQESTRNTVRTTWIPQNKLMLGDMLKYAVAAAKGGDKPEIVLGTMNDKGDIKNSERSKSGALLGWSADEALAAAVYLFVKFAQEPQGFWKGIQQGAWTPGDSDSIASLAGVLLGAFCGIDMPENERMHLKNLENYADFEKDAAIITKWVSSKYS